MHKIVPSKSKFIIRDLSWLSFNGRVLQEAEDTGNHLHDRLRFLGIFSNNLDEFFRVRVATLNKMVKLGGAAKMQLESNPDKILKQIQSTVVNQQSAFERIFKEIVDELAEQNIFLKTEKQLNKEQREFVTRYFDEKVHTRIVPLMVESIPTMPLLRDRSIYLACVLGHDTNPLMQRYALIELPVGELSRFVLLPSKKGVHDIILLEDVIRFNLPYLFAPFGFNRFMGHTIKVTRDAELDMDSDLQSNVIDELEKGLKNRKKGKATRFVYDKQIDPNLLDWLVKRLSLSRKDNLIPGGRIHNFKDFMDFPKSVFSNLNERPRPFVHPLLQQPCRILDVLSRTDVMLHLPYHSFDSVIDLLRESAIDPAVVSIKITLYRLASDSKVINALINAVRNGKQVVVVIELKARFDEEANLRWRRRLEEEGVTVKIGLPNMKVHAKICVIKRREFNQTRHFGFVSTGNLNESTARIYGDHCLLTSNSKILADVNKVFECLERESPNLVLLKSLKTLVASPVSTRKFFQTLIDKQVALAKKKRPASVIVKLNSLSDKPMIENLYNASKAGVQLELVIRGICCAITDQKSFKVRPRAISIVDQYLEHARVMIFGQGASRQVFISSADWMSRNLDNRVEISCPIENQIWQDELSHIMNIQLRENQKARILDSALSNQYVDKEDGDVECRSQILIYQYLASKEYTLEPRSH
ncbi:MAG: polyphosphate kinase 1 [Bacteroidota bacterium]